MYTCAMQNVAELESDVRGLKRECTERDELLLDKDRRIADVKGAVVELQKLKFVLEYKVDELRAQALPREQKLEALNAQISVRRPCCPCFLPRDILCSGLVCWLAACRQCILLRCVDCQMMLCVLYMGNRGVSPAV